MNNYRTAFINGIILDGTRDMVPVKDKVIIVEDKKIVSIEDKSSANLSDCRVVDLGGKYILPGLINLHAHLPGTGKPTKKPMNLELICKLLSSNPLGQRIGKGMVASNAKNALMAGVTTIRSLGGIADFDSAVRDDIKNGKLIGPRIITANSAITVKGGHMANTFAYVASSKEEVVELVDKIAKTKPDLIKLMITGGVMDTNELGLPGMLLMPAEYIKTACDRAHSYGYKVAAHVQGYDGVIAALENGVDTIEHGASPDDKMLDLFNKKGAAQVVTLSPAIPYVQRFQNMSNLSEVAVENSTVIIKGMVELAKECLKNKIPVGIGTDSSCTYVTQYGFWREIVHFVNYCGVSNSFALHTATLINAQIAGIDKITGSIEVGKMADMIVVENNPLEDLSALQNVSMVVFEGNLFIDPKVKKIPEVETVLDEHMA